MISEVLVFLLLSFILMLAFSSMMYDTPLDKCPINKQQMIKKIEIIKQILFKIIHSVDIIRDTLRVLRNK